jgi:carbonic anhydrase
MKARLWVLILWLVLILPGLAAAQPPAPGSFEEESAGITCAYPEEAYVEPVVVTTETDHGICKENPLGCEGAGFAAVPAVVGNLQSPIDLFGVAGVPAAPVTFQLFNYHFNHTWDVGSQHGHTVYNIQHFAWPFKPFARVDGHNYLLRQFHCHNGPEHWVRGNNMNGFFECHYVHESESTGAKAVVGVYLRVPPPAPFVVARQINVPPGVLIPCAPWKYTYQGSLTAPPDGVSPPPYPEGVAWMIPWNNYKDVDVSFRNFLLFTAPHPVLRGPQPRNGREIRIIP